MIHHHEFWWRFFPKKELTQVYVSSALRSFALSLVAIFVPLYLYHEMGFSLGETLMFFIFYSVVFAITTPFAAKFSARFGIKHAVLLSVPLYLLFIGSLYSLPYINMPLVVISSLLGLSQAFYWLGMHLVFHKASDHKHRGEEVGKRGGFSIVGSLFGPLLGGILITSVGFNSVFCLAGIFLILAAVILFKSKEKHVKYHFSVRSVINKKHWQDSLYFVSSGMQDIALGVIWPLFIFFILKSYLALGIIGSLIAGVSAVLLIVFGKFSDHIGKRKIVKWITGFESLAWILKALSFVAIHVYGATIFGAIVQGIRQSPLGALEYDKARGEVAAYFVSREIFICLGRILLLTFVLMTNSLTGGLVFQGVASFAALLF